MILHCDLDAFFASVEQALRPELAGHPVAVSAGRGQGMVTAASYEARAYGVRTGMPFRQARALCPEIRLVTSRFDAYRRAGAAVQDAIAETAPHLESVGIDECFVDVTHCPGVVDSDDPHAAAVELASRIRLLVRERFGLAITIGGASSKTVAKLCSDKGKPDGSLLLAPGDELELLHRTPVGDLSGVGPRTTERLHTLGVLTVADLHRLSATSLRRIFGSHLGTWLYQLARNELAEPVDSRHRRKSISVMRTFRSAPDDLVGLYEQLLGELLTRLFDAKRAASQVTVLLVVNGELRRRSRRFPSATDDLTELAAAARGLFAAIGVGPLTAGRLSAGVQAVGISLDGLTDTVQLALSFGPPSPVTATPPIEIPGTPDLDLRLESCAYRGMPVTHPVFGAGTVLSLTDRTVTICFTDRARTLELWAPLEF